MATIPKNETNINTRNGNQLIDSPKNDEDIKHNVVIKMQWDMRLVEPLLKTMGIEYELETLTKALFITRFKEEKEKFSKPDWTKFIP